MEGNALSNFVFDNPTKLLFGTGKLGELHNEVLPGRKALLLTSAGKSAKLNGSLDKTMEELTKAGVSYVHLGNVVENPLKENCEAAGKFAKENECDFIVALGGGAVLDSAVPVSIMAVNDGDLWDYVSGGTGKGKIAANAPLPIVAIATSSGTGSEMNEWGVICKEDTNEKIGMGDRRCKPVIAVVDPLYMTTVPAKYTAYQGFDALFHNTEVIMSTGLNIMSEAIALSAIENIYQYLPIAVREGTNIEAREHIAYASTMAGITMQLTSTTAQHSMEHAMSAFHRNLQHGAGLIMISKEFAQFFIDKHACDDRFIKMARVMGYPESNDPQDFVKALVRLQEECDVAGLKMSDYGFTIEECLPLAKAARNLQGGLFAANPCETTDEEIAGIFERSFR